MNVYLCWIFAILTLFVSLGAGGNFNIQPLSEELVNYINSHPQATWKAAMTDRFKTLDDAKVLLGARFEDKLLKKQRRPTVTHEDKIIDLPEFFDARKEWPRCPSIGHIRDQSKCGSCWAFGAVEAMSDRVCIHKSTHLNKSLSARDLMSCCTTCGFGCEGGFLGPSWDYLRDYGIVTGGDYDDNSSCLPYPFPPCKHYDQGPYPPCPRERYKTPECVRQCKSDYFKPYRYDVIKSKSSYNVLNTEDAIMKEIMLNGPVEAAFDVHVDFLNYNSGVYRAVTTEIVGSHAIKILGWGVEKGVKYWLCANSWNDGWGDKGFFKFLRGVNECGIEYEVVAGLL